MQSMDCPVQSSDQYFAQQNIDFAFAKTMDKADTRKITLSSYISYTYKINLILCVKY